jgi:hypothetical protein
MDYVLLEYLAGKIISIRTKEYLELKWQRLRNVTSNPESFQMRRFVVQ